MTPEELKEIEQYAEIRLRTGDVMAAHCLLLAMKLREAHAEIVRLNHHLNPKPEQE